MYNHRTHTTGVVLFICAAILIVGAAPFIGIQAVSWDSVMHPSWDRIGENIFWNLRVPRVLVSFLAGVGLALSGMAFQALFRNPLATPFTLGVASGASLGAAVYVKLGLMFSLLGISGISLFAFIGSVCSIFLVYGLTMIKRNFSTSTLLLAGVAISFFFSSMILFVQYMSSFSHSFHIVRWIMGGLDVVGYSSVFRLMPFVVGGSLIVYYLTHELNLLTLGEDIALSRGVQVTRIKHVLFFAVSLMIGGVVSLCGPIGFVGMMVPHICRLLVGSDHRYLTPMTILFGGMFLTVCDTLARTLIAPTEMPVGIITALLGGPFFIWLLVGKSSSARSIF